MPVAPPGFPSKVDDSELEATIDSLEDMIAVWSTSNEWALPELQLTLLRAGLDERSRRANDRAARDSLRIAMAGTWVGVAGVVVAVIALAVALMR